MLLLLVGAGVLRCLLRRQPEAIAREVVAATVPAPAPRWRLVRPLTQATAAALLGVAVLTIPHMWHSNAAASVEVSSPQALRRVSVRGASSGAISASLTARSFFIARPDTASAHGPQWIEMTTPVADPAACLRLARSLGGGCGAPAERAIAGEDVAVDGDAPLSLRIEAAARAGLTLETAGEGEKIDVAAPRVRLTLGCGDENGTITVTVSDRRHVVPRACAPSSARVVLTLLLRYDAPVRIYASQVETLDVSAPGRSAEISALRPTVVLEGKATTLLDATASRLSVVLPSTGAFTIARTAEAGLPVVRVASPDARHVGAEHHGELLASRFDEWRDYLFALAGVLFGVSASLLTTLPQRS
jgi:hypothetical protein